MHCKLQTIFQWTETGPFISWPQRLTISQGRLCDLDWWERDETAKAYFDEIIDDFASVKAREVLF